MNDGAGAVTPGMPNLPASMDNFDAIVGSYDNVPPPAAEPAPKAPKLSDVAPIENEPVEGEEGLELDAEAEGFEPEVQPEPELGELAAKWQDLETRPDLPDEFLQKKILATVDGETKEITVEQARDSWQRRAITTQKQQEAAQVKNYYDQLIQGQRAQHQRWNQNPDHLEQDLVDMELEPHLERIVHKRFKAFAQEQAILDSITDPNHREWTRQRFAAEKKLNQDYRAEQRAKTRAQQEAQQNSGQTQHEALVQRTSNQMAQLGPAAMREVKFPLGKDGKFSPYIRGLVGKEVQALHRWGTDLTKELVLEAARNAKDVWDAEHEQTVTADAEKRLAKRSKALPPRRVAPGPGAGPAKAPRSQQPARVSDFDAVMKELDAGRR